MNLIEDLRYYGFDEKEAKIYLAMLTLGEGTANDISKKAELIRTTVYDILQKLSKEGFISSIEKNGVLIFEATSPEKLVENLEIKMQRIKQSIPYLNKIKKEPSIKPKVEFYDGKEGVKTIFQKILNAKKPLIAYSNNKYMFNLLPFFGPNFIKKRIEKKIPLKILSEDSEVTFNILKKNDKKEYRKTKIMKELDKIAINQYVYGDYVAILGSKENEPMGILIKHKDFANCQRIIFERLWKTSKN